MCLAIDNSVKLPKANKEGLCIGYKVVFANHSSVFWSHQYHVGINHSSRKTKKFSIYEKAKQHVFDGFHVILSLSDARTQSLDYPNSKKVIRVYFRPVDVVSTGVWKERQEINCVVVKKLLVKSLIGIK